jgi:hypothetical protein
MIDWNKIRKIENNIKKENEKLITEKDFKKRERIKLKIKIEELRIKLEKIEKLN